MLYSNRLMSMLSAAFVIVFMQTVQAAQAVLSPLASAKVAAENRATVTRQGNIIYTTLLPREGSLSYPTPPATLTNDSANARHALVIRSIDMINSARKIGATYLACYFPEDLLHENYEVTLEYAGNNPISRTSTTNTQQVLNELQKSYNLHGTCVTLAHHQKSTSALYHDKKAPDSGCTTCREIYLRNRMRPVTPHKP